VVPVTNNLTASVVQVATAQPRIGYPLEIVTAIQAAENTPNVSVSYFALNGDDIAQELEEVRQFYLGTVTFDQVQTSIGQYRARLTVPTSVSPPGDYVIMCSLDPSDLIEETDEDDNLAEVAATIAPMADPNLFLEDLVLDRQSLVLDVDVDDVAGVDPNDVQNSDGGGTLVIGLEGTLDPVEVEAFVRLRITRTDLPAGQDTHDVPLYLWDSTTLQYVDAFGLQGPEQWLSLGELSPAAANETETEVDVDNAGTKSIHLDVYLPGKLAEVMVAILENLTMGPPTQAPPDLRLQDIQALYAFFAGASLRQLRFEFIADIRAVGGAFQDANPADNTLSRPFYLVLPGEESSAPDRPIAFEEGLDAAWESDKFGVGFDFDSYGSLDGRGAIAEVRGSVPAEVFGNAFDFMAFDARAQVVPAVDISEVPAGETSGFFLDLEFASLTVYTYEEDLGYTFDGTFSVTKEKTFSKQFFVGPVPVSTSGGVAGEIGYQLTANLQPASLANSVRPYAKLEATVEAGVGTAGFRAGAGGSLTLVDESFLGTVQTGLSVLQAGGPQAAAVFEGAVSMRVTNTVTGPAGRLFLFVEYPGVKWCRRCALRRCVSFPCGVKTVRREFDLVTWRSFVKEDVLFDETLCKRVTLDLGSATFSVCQNP